MAGPSDTQAQNALDVERLSKLLFGSSLRLPVAGTIAGSDLGVLNVGELVEALNLPAERYTAVRSELEHFADAGLLMRLPRPKGQRIQEYERLESAYWSMASQVLDEVRSRR